MVALRYVFACPHSHRQTFSVRMKTNVGLGMSKFMIRKRPRKNLCKRNCFYMFFPLFCCKKSWNTWTFRCLSIRLLPPKLFFISPFSHLFYISCNQNIPENIFTNPMLASHENETSKTRQDRVRRKRCKKRASHEKPETGAPTKSNNEFWWFLDPKHAFPYKIHLSLG